MRVTKGIEEFPISLREAATRRFRFRAVRKLTHLHRTSVAARFACIPGDSIGDAIIAHGMYERDFLDPLFHFASHRKAEFAEGIAIDIGANIGNHAVYFSRRFARVLAFEPNPLTFHLLEANILLNDVRNLEAFAVGLGAESAELEYVQNAEHNLGASGFSEFHKRLSGPRKMLPVRNADAFLEERLTGVAAPVRLIKIDVGPFSSQVLQGLKGTLDRYKPMLICELIGEQAAADRAFLEQCGYTHFYSVERAATTARTRLGRLVQNLANRNIRLLELGAASRPLYDNVIATAGRL